MRIIVADDMPVQARQTADAVRHTFPGWEVLTAGGGQEVLRLLRQAPTDIVLSDIRMPGMDGLEMLHEMRQLSPKTRVVFITAYPLFEYAQKALKLGATDLLLKPVDPDALTDLLSRLGGGTAGVADRDLRLWLDCPWNMLDEGIRRRISEQYPRGCVCAVCIPSGGTDVPSAARLAGMLGRELGCRLQALERREASGQLTCALVCPQTEEICRRLGGSLRTAALRYGFRAGISAFSSHLPREGRALFTEAMRGADRAFYESAGVSACDHADAAPAPEVPSAAKLLSWFRSGPGLWREPLTAFLAAAERTRPEPAELIAQTHRSLEECGAMLRGPDAPDTVPAGSALDRVVFFNEYCSCLEAALGTLAEEYRRSPEVMGPVAAARAYVLGHYMEQITLADVAERIHLSPNYFSTLFRAETSMRFMEYVQQVRMEKASAMLLETDLPVSGIAEACGYKDVHYFNRVYQKAYGISPIGFRRNFSAGSGK